MTKEIQLTNNKVALVDDEDYEWLSRWKWKYGSDSYARRDITINGTKKSISMHRLIMHTPAGLEVDHINHDGLDNRKINLRNCTHSENDRNRVIPRNNSSGFIGVHWDKSRNRWRAEITYRRKRFYIGLFININDAAEAYNKKAKELFGEYANIENVYREAIELPGQMVLVTE